MGLMAGQCIPQTRSTANSVIETRLTAVVDETRGNRTRHLIEVTGRGGRRPQLRDQPRDVRRRGLRGETRGR
jgi:hypothetical protein